MPAFSILSTLPKAIPLHRAILGGIALLSAGVALGMTLAEMSGPTLASAPDTAPRGSGLTNSATDEAAPLRSGQIADQMRGSQDRSSALQSAGPLSTAGPLQQAGPIDGQLASVAGVLPQLPGEVAGMREAATPADRWTALNNQVASILNAGTPTPETLTQLVSLVNNVPPTGPSSALPNGGPGTTPSVTPLPPTVYEGTNKTSPN